MIMESESQTPPGGYDNYFLCDTEKYHCPVCLLVLHEAMQTSCGHRFCQSCIDRVIGKSTMLKCPVDKQFSKLTQIFPDVAIRREVMSLPVQCSHEECPWEGDLRGFESHIKRCEMEEVPCPFDCGITTRRGEVDTHVETCPLRDIECKYCFDKIQHHIFECHLSECLKVPVPCPLCLEEGFLREDLEDHKDPFNGSCPEAVIKCPYSKIGCDFTSKRARMSDHLKSPLSIASHLETVSDTITEHENLQRGLKDLISKLSNRVESMELQMRGWDKKVDAWKQHLINRTVTGQMHWKVELRGRGEYYSKPFHTGCPGYKVQVDLDTDTSRDGNIRFCLTLLRGDYDDSMMWPFNATCNMTILDQKVSSTTKNYSVSMVIREVPRNRQGSRTDRLFKRYLPKSIKRDEIIGQGSRFVKNGCLYLEVSVIHCVFPVADAVPTRTITNVVPMTIPVHSMPSPIAQSSNASPGSPVFSLSSAVSLMQ